MKQYSEFFDYEGDVLDALENIGEMDRSDAQGIAMTPKCEDIIEDAYYSSNGLVDATEVAKKVLDASLV